MNESTSTRSITPPALHSVFAQISAPLLLPCNPSQLSQPLHTELFLRLLSTGRRRNVPHRWSTTNDQRPILLSSCGGVVTSGSVQLTHAHTRPAGRYEAPTSRVNSFGILPIHSLALHCFLRWAGRFRGRPNGVTTSLLLPTQFQL